MKNRLRCRGRSKMTIPQVQLDCMFLETTVQRNTFTFKHIICFQLHDASKLFSESSEFTQDDPDMEEPPRADWWTCMRSSTTVQSCAWMRRTHISRRRGSLLLASQGMGQEVPRQRRTRGESLVEAKREEEGCEGFVKNHLEGPIA